MNEHHNRDANEPPRIEEPKSTGTDESHRHHGRTSIRIYSHSSMLFWWPVWLIDLLNVLFIGSKVDVMQRLIAEVPEGPED